MPKNSQAPTGTGAAAGGKTATGSGGKGGQIGLVSAIAFAVGTMVGGGVFALSGIVVADAGPGAIIAYIVAGVVMMLSALCFAAVASRAKPGDSGYGPVGTELSPVWRFITEWSFYLCGVTSVAYVLISFGSYLKYFFSGSDALIVAIAAAIALMLLNFGPTGFVGKAETAMVVFKITVLVIMILFALIAFAPQHFTPFVPHGTGSILSATAMLFAAYTGFNVVTNMAGAIKNPQKNVPLAIMLSLAIVAVIYIGVAVALVSSGIDSEKLKTQGLAHAAEAIGGHFGVAVFAGTLVAIAACVSTLSGANANLLGAAELVGRMSAEREIPSGLGRLSAKGHPVRSVAISGTIVVLLMLTGDMKMIIVFSNVTAIVAMVLVDLTAFRMGTKKWAGKGMKLPLGWLIPALAVLAALAQLPSLVWWQVLIGFALVALGFVIYAFKGSGSHKAIAEEIKGNFDRHETPLLRFFRRDKQPYTRD
ncbi:MAG: APC family permease [Mycetocola sp.]